MPTQQELEAMPMEEFIALPDTIDLVFTYSKVLQDFVDERPYIRLSKLIISYYVVAYTQIEYLQSILDELGMYDINVYPMTMGLLGRQELESAGIVQVQQQPHLNLSGQGVLIGFTDTGIDYTNPAFIYEDGTSKIKYIWDQTLSGNAPEGYYFGTEFTNSQINAALASADPSKLVPHADTVGHGTFLASVAASRDNNNFLGAAPDADLIIVKLKKALKYYTDFFCTTKKQDNVFESSNVMLGVEYILEKAYELSQPISVCISTGTNLGSHDGLNVMELFLTDLCSDYRLAVSVAPGNESNMKHHTSGRLPKTSDTTSIEIKCGDSREDIFLSVWNYSSDQISVSITSPAGEVVGRVPVKTGSTYSTKLILESSKITVKYYYPVSETSSQLTIIKIHDPTPGIWKITLYGDIIINGEYHAWLPLTGLVDPDIEFLSPTPHTTIVTPATSIGTITSGAYNSHDNSLYTSSSWGPTRMPLNSPLMVAPGENVSGIFPSGVGVMSGTSVSSAITAGACALMLQWGVIDGNELSMNSYYIRSKFIKGCLREPDLTYPNDQWGYGKFNLMNTFVMMRM